jgi:hypothetical protein
MCRCIRLRIGFAVAAVVAAASVASAQTASGTQSQPAQKQDAQRSTATNSTAPTVIDLGKFEESPQQYVGKTVTLRGEVSKVVGPRLFTIDEPNWIDLDPETLVLVPAPFAAIVRSDQPVTVTGKVQPFVEADVAREWGWFGNKSGVRVDLKNRPVVVATNVTTTNGVDALLSLNVSLPAANPPNATNSSTQPKTAVGTSGSASSSSKPPVTDAKTLAAATDTKLVGRPVSLTNVRVAEAADRGFWIDENGQWLFVLQPDRTTSGALSKGRTVSITGVVLQFPKQMKRQMGERAQDEPVYVQAQSIS